MDYISPIITASVVLSNLIEVNPNYGISITSCDTLAQSSGIHKTIDLVKVTDYDIISEILRRASADGRFDVIAILTKYGSGDVLENILKAEDANAYSTLIRYANQLSIKLAVKQPTRYVGALADKWTFPSDHLPIGATIDDFNVASFNVLNNLYFSWVTDKDSQGLNGSLLTDHHFIVDPKTGLTQRNIDTAEIVWQMIDHPTHPKSVIALQECGVEFVQHLTENLPEHFALINTASKYSQNQNVMIYDTRLFTLEDTDCSFSYAIDPKKPLLEVTLKHNISQKSYQFFNMHIPGDPSGAGVDELADYFLDKKNTNAYTILLGDSNFTESQMEAEFRKIALEKGLDAKAFKDNFELWGNYNTNISPRTAENPLSSKKIDHIIIWGEKPSVLDLPPEHVVPGLQPTVDLL